MTVTSANAPFSDTAALVERVLELEALGLSAAWFPSGRGADPVPLMTLAAYTSSRIELGSFVVPVAGRHPATLAAELRTAAAIAGRGLTVGIGAGHQEYVPYRQVTGGLPLVDYLGEYLSVLRAGLAGRPMVFTGRAITCDLRSTVAAPRCPVLLAALSPRLAELAGASADGVAIWLCGRDRVRELASRFHAVRERPGRVVVGVPLVVTDDVATARARVDALAHRYGALATYARALRRVSDPAEIAVIGDRAAVLDQLAAWRAASVTDLVAVFVPVDGDPDCFARTCAVLATAVRDLDDEPLITERTVP